MIEHQPVAPFLVIEYVSKSSENKDHENNYLIYEREVRVPYYLVCHPEEEELLLFKLRRKNLEYATVKPSSTGRYAIPELELELVMHDGWLRYLFRGEFMEMPSDYYKQNKEMKAELDSTRQQRLTAEAEIEQLKAMLAAARGT